MNRTVDTHTYTYIRIRVQDGRRGSWPGAWSVFGCLFPSILLHLPTYSVQYLQMADFIPSHIHVPEKREEKRNSTFFLLLRRWPALWNGDDEIVPQPRRRRFSMWWTNCPSAMNGEGRSHSHSGFSPVCSRWIFSIIPRMHSYHHHHRLRRRKSAAAVVLGVGRVLQKKKRKSRSLSGRSSGKKSGFCPASKRFSFLPWSEAGELLITRRENQLHWKTRWTRFSKRFHLNSDCLSS